MTGKIEQKRVTAHGGSVVGRDQNNITYQVTGTASPMTKLSMAFWEEVEKDEQIASVLPELEHYMSNVDVDEVIGLEEKLKAANKNSTDIVEAKRQKEIVAKRLHRHSTTRAAQKIYIHMLGMLLHRFRAFVKPKIENGSSAEEINQEIILNVIEPAINILEENVLDIYWDDIWGMIFYLTGNCHIKWTE